MKMFTWFLNLMNNLYNIYKKSSIPLFYSSYTHLQSLYEYSDCLIPWIIKKILTDLKDVNNWRDLFICYAINNRICIFLLLRKMYDLPTSSCKSCKIFATSRENKLKSMWKMQIIITNESKQYAIFSSKHTLADITFLWFCDIYLDTVLLCLTYLNSYNFIYK
jgi:hypothetical protein